VNVCWQMSSVKVAVRVRPLNSRELAKDCSCIIDMSDKTTTSMTTSLSLSLSLSVPVCLCMCLRILFSSKRLHIAGLVYCKLRNSGARLPYKCYY